MNYIKHYYHELLILLGIRKRKTFEQVLAKDIYDVFEKQYEYADFPWDGRLYRKCDGAEPSALFHVEHESD